MSRSAGSRSTDRRMFALVKWLNGTSEGTLSIVDTDWIIDFDPSTSAFDPTGYAVEWRHPPKSRTGWHMYNAIVIDVSDDKDVLKRREREEVNGRNNQARAQTPAQTPNRNTIAASDRSDQAPTNDALLRNLINLLNGGQQAAEQCGGTSAVDENQVKVGKSLSLPRSIYMEAKGTRTPTSMTMILVRSSFSRRRLMRSTYAGQRRTTRDGRVEKKPGLKQYQKMRDIQGNDFVRTRFPFMPQSVFGSAVNACTGTKAEKRQEIEYMEISEEEVDDDDDLMDS